MNNQKGFVLIEFVIALPLILMLLYGLAETTLQIYRLAKAQAADYVLAVEAQEVLTRITEDLRASKTVERKLRFSNKEIDTLIIKYHTLKNDNSAIIDVIDQRVYKVGTNYNLHAKRQNDNSAKNPVTGGNFFGDTVINKLKYSLIGEKVIHIKLEMKSLETNNVVTLSTAVYMPACESTIGF